MPKLSSLLTPRIRRIGGLIGIATAILLFFLLVVVSPLAKYLIQKYDDKILGRTIELSWAYVNPFTGYVYLNNVRVYEQDSDTLFFKADGITANFSMLKLFKKTYEISSLTVTRPWGHIVQNKTAINFRDIIEHFRPKEGTIVVNKKRVRFSILDCAIKDGVFQYDEITLPVTYYVKQVDIHSPGKWWNADTMFFKVALESGPTKGKVTGNITINFNTLNYRFAGVFDSFDIKPISQYMSVLSNYGIFGGILNADVEGSGNFKSKFVRTTGLISLNQFHFGPSVHEQYGSFQRLVLDIADANPEGKQYRIDSVMLDRPYFRYEKYDTLDNLSMMFKSAGKRPGIGSADAQFNLILKIAEYLQELLRNFAKSDYRINKLTVHKGNFVFSDFSLYEKFSIDAMPVHIHADSIDKNKPRLKLRLNTEVRPYGDILVNVSLDPKNFGTFDIDYQVNTVPVSLFNPYLVTYTSFPLNRGTLQLNGKWNVLDSAISSTNHLVIMNPRVGTRLKQRDTKWIPLPLIMSVARGPGEVIDYEIPVNGNLKRPEFDLKHVILDVVSNIFVKPPMTPYLMHVKSMGNTVDRMLSIEWEARQATLSQAEKQFVNTITKFLKDNPSNRITVSPQVYAAREKEHIAFFEGKKKYFLSSRSRGYKISEDDSLSIEQLSVKDPSFVGYLNKAIGDSMIFSTESKCLYIVGDALIENRLQQLNEARKRAFLSAFVEAGADAQIKFSSIEEAVPFNGFSRYRINYNGDVPEQLRKAYESMEQSNQQVPRKKHNDKRWLPKVKGIARNSKANSNAD